MHTYIFKCICTYVHVYVCEHVCIHMHACSHTYAGMCTYIYSHSHLKAQCKGERAIFSIVIAYLGILNDTKEKVKDKLVAETETTNLEIAFSLDLFPVLLRLYLEVVFIVLSLPNLSDLNHIAFFLA